MAQIISEESFTKKTKKSKKSKRRTIKTATSLEHQLLSLHPSPTTTSSSSNEQDSSSEEESDNESVQEEPPAKIITNLNNENVQLKRQIDELDTKLNLLINNLNKEQVENRSQPK